jgi:HNH endonuclease
MAKVNKTDGCWLWTGTTSHGGYGSFRMDGRQQGAHRVAYVLFRGPIPDGLTIDHLCRVPGCVNPDHLEAVTMRENTLRGVSKVAQQARKTHCLRGHPLSGDNLWVRGGKRFCRTCAALVHQPNRNARERAARAARRARSTVPAFR